MDLFKLIGTIAVDNSGAVESIDETSEHAESFGSKLLSGIGTAAKWGASIVAAGSAAAGGLTKIVTSGAGAADNIDKMSQKIGISRDAYQELDFICSQSGTSVDGLQMGVKSLTSAMDGARNGTASNIEQFEKLGVSVTNADGSFRSQEDVLFDTLAALQGMEDQTEKSRLATELFGRSGTELMPLLNGAAGSIDSMREQAHDLGLVLSDEVIDSGVEVTDTMDQVKRQFTALGNNLGGSLMPVLQNVLKFIQDQMPMIQELFNKIAPVIATLFESLLPPLMELITTLLPPLIEIIAVLIEPLSSIFQTLLPIFVEILNTILPPLIEIIQALLPPFMAILEAILPIFQTVIDLLTPIIELVLNLITPIVDLISQAITPLIETFGNLINGILTPFIPLIQNIADIIGQTLSPIFDALSPIIKSIFDALNPLIESFGTLISSILEPIMPIISAVASLFSEVLGGAINALMPIVKGIMDIFGNLIKFITGVFSGNWSSAWEGIVGVFKGIFNLIPTIVEGIINAAIAIINGIIGGINKVTGLIGIPEIPKIPDVSLPRFANGGVIEDETTGIIGEDGDEAILPLENNTAGTRRIAETLYNMMPLQNESEIASSVQGAALKMEEAFTGKMNRLEDIVDALFDFLQRYIPIIAEKEDILVMNDGTVAAKLAPQIDKHLADIYRKKARK